MMNNGTTVVMMGLGYIGLPTAALIASNDIHVHGVDINESIVNTINNGAIHIVEPSLDGLVYHAVQRGFLKASLKPREADVFIVAVPTPFKGDNHAPDISYVQSATEMVIPFLKEGDLFIIESTSPVGTTEKMAELIFSRRPELKDKIYVSYCPERVLPGNVIYELKNNDRVIGGLNEASTQRAKKFYGLFVQGEFHGTSARVAEMCKLVENSYRDVNIAFANELSVICSQAGINVYELIALANRHPRVNILNPGPGVGGHCIAVDPWFIVSAFPEQARMIRQAREINNYKTEWVIEQINNAATHLQKSLGREPVIACLGLSFKPDIDDLRESPALDVALHLQREGKGKLIVVEPHVSKHAQLTLTTYEKAVEQADLVVVLVAHKHFKQKLEHTDLRGKKILDFVGITFKR